MQSKNKYIPLLDTLKNYHLSLFKKDALSGITLGLILIPQGIAYAIIAGLPPIFGLYSAVIPPIVYSFFGTSRRMSIGAAAMDSLIIAAGLSTLNYTNQLDYISAAITVCFLAGITQIVLGIFKFGFFANFLSKPVISGFTSAAALIIALSQVKNIFGIDIENSNQIQYVVTSIFKNIQYTNYPTFIFGLSCIVLLLALKRISKKIPGPVVAVFIFTLITYILKDGFAQNFDLVGNVPSGFPEFTGSLILWNDIIKLSPLVLTIALISYMQSISIAKSLQDIKNDHEVDNNQEMRAIGLGAVAGSLFGSYSSAGGFSRSAVNLEAGAKTPVSLIIGSLFILATLLFMTDLFYYLPKSIIAAIIITAIIRLIDIKYAISLFKTSKEDFAMLIITFAVTISIGITEGLGVGVFLSIALLLFKSTKPHIAICGRIPNTDNFKNIKRFDNLETYKDILILRIDSNLYFANIDTVTSFIKDQLYKNDEIKLILIKAESINSIDSTSLKILEDFILKLKGQGVSVSFSGVIGPVRDLFYKTKFIDKLGDNHLFINPLSAIEDFQNATPDQNKSFANQHN
jgi:SulP family sulfate permease